MALRGVARRRGEVCLEYPYKRLLHEWGLVYVYGRGPAIPETKVCDLLAKQAKEHLQGRFFLPHSKLAKHMACLCDFVFCAVQEKIEFQLTGCGMARGRIWKIDETCLALLFVGTAERWKNRSFGQMGRWRRGHLDSSLQPQTQGAQSERQERACMARLRGQGSDCFGVWDLREPVFSASRGSPRTSFALSWMHGSRRDWRRRHV